MNAAALIAILCISPVVDVPAAKGSLAFKIPAECAELALKSDGEAKPAAESAAAVKPRAAKRKSSRKVKLADRCGSMRAVWYVKANGHRKYRCR